MVSETEPDSPDLGPPDADIPPAEETQQLIAQLREEVKREQAAFYNFRMARSQQAEIERDRLRGELAQSLLPVLDDLDRAEQHGDLAEGSPLAAVAGKIRGSLQKLGLETFGAVGETFDPVIHEAFSQIVEPQATAADTVHEIILPGYRLGQVVVRPAKVVVRVTEHG